MKQAAITSYGTAGPEFVRRIINNKGVTRETVNADIAEFVASHVQSDADGQVKRAAHRFAVIAAAGELAISLGVAPWKKGDAIAASAWALAQWIEARGGVAPAEKDQAIKQVRMFIEQHGDSRFDSKDTYSKNEIVETINEQGNKVAEVHPVTKKIQTVGFRDRAGYRSEKDGEYYVLPEVFKNEVCKGLNHIQVAQTLADKWLLRRGRDALQITIRVPRGMNAELKETRRVYAIRDAILEQGGEVDDDDDADKPF
jgi:uncharacterized protein (DUF927 family)